MAEHVVDLMPCDVMFGGVDVREPVVRCRDCRFWATEMRHTGMCTGRKLDPNGFCAWGERKGLER